jgi:DNA-binding response OmpR family regulator
MLVALVGSDVVGGAALKQDLERQGFTVELVPTGAAALARFARRDLDAAVVDMGLSDMDGVQVIAAVRGAGMWAPILVTTVSGEVGERVRALEAGADDYAVKPLASAELVARLRALGRRAAAPRWAPLACGKIVLGAEGEGAMVDGRPVNLSPRERGLLEVLLRRRGQVVSRDEILTEVFGYEFNPGTNLINVHVARLRRKIAGGRVAIETLRGIGFRLKPLDQ